MAEGDSGYDLTAWGNEYCVYAVILVEGLRRLLHRLEHSTPRMERELSEQVRLEEWLPGAFRPASTHPRMIVVSSSRSLVKILDQGSSEWLAREIEGYIIPCSVKKESL